MSNVQQRIPQRVRFARLAVALCFFINGVLAASLPTRLPTLQEKLALSSGQLGIALLGCTIGGLLAMNLAGRLAQLVGSKLITMIGTLSFCLPLPLIVFAPNFLLLIIALTFFGAGSGAMDIGMNMQGADIERAYQRPIFNSFHACFSVGSLMGAFLGGFLVTWHVSSEIHFLAITVLSCIATLWIARYLFPSNAAQKAVKVSSKKALTLQFSPILIMLGLIAFSSMLSVGAMFDWSTLYLADTLRMQPVLAAMGFNVFLLCTAIGRAIGDYLVTRWGPVRLMRVAGVLVVSGFVCILFSAWVPVILCGLGLIGFGLSVPFPLVLSAAGRMDGSGKSSALLTVTTYGYVGILVGPAVIGFVGEGIGLHFALGLVMCLCCVVVICAPALGSSKEKLAEEMDMVDQEVSIK